MVEFYYGFGNDENSESKENHAIVESFSRLIRFLGNGKVQASDIAIHIIFQDDLFDRKYHLSKDDNNNLTYPRKFLDQKPNLQANDRFLFLHIDDEQYYQKFDFWRKLLGNLEFGDVINPINHKKIINFKDQDNIATYIVSSIEELCKDTDSVFANNILIKLHFLDEKFKEEEKFKDYHIDEIGSHEKIAHDDKEKKKLLFYSHLREALLDWSKQNKWVLSNEDSDGYKEDFNFLILDDVIWKEDWPEESSREEDFETYLKKCLRITNKLSDRKWTVYRLKKGEDGVNRFAKQIKNILEDKAACFESIFSEKNKANSSPTRLKDFLKKTKITHILEKTEITHILVDWMLDESGNYIGFNLVRELNSWIDRNKENLNIIPEILILSRSNDPVTIQSALDAGASGYIVKDNIGELPLIVGRAGRPLKVKQADEINDLLIDNFPSLKSFPTFVPKSLYFDIWKKNPDIDPNGVISGGTKEYDKPSILNEHREWLKKIPKADLHVHFGTAIPIYICYDLAIISVYRWLNQYKYEAGSEDYKGSNRDKKQQITDAKNLIEEILKSAVEDRKEKNAESFRYRYIEAFKKITNIYEVVTVNNTIKRLHRRFDKLSEELIACLVVVGLGFLRKDGYTADSINARIKELDEISQTLFSGKIENPLLKFYLQDTTKIIKAVVEIYNDKRIEISPYYNFSKRIESFDPLSNLLSIPDQLRSPAQGLPKYLGAGDLVGSSILQFTETLLLASYHIPIWAARQNVWHQELRAGSSGFLKSLKNSTISTKVMMLGLYAGLKAVEKEVTEKSRTNKYKYLTTSVLITPKRHKDKEEIKESVQIATEFIAKNEEAAKEINSKGFIPKVLGMDLAGIERGNLPEEIVEQFRESFKRCLMMTVHAGEDESVESVWQAVYSLHALRVGHGLRLDDHPDLKRLFKDRQLCVELCPKSNQFTNGYTLFKAEKNDVTNSNKQLEKVNISYYVFEDYWKYGIPLAINTDNPVLSYRANNTGMKYPLCEEYLALPHLLGTNSKRSSISDNSPLSINRLLILKLIYNGFKHSFLNPEDKACLIERADTEVFNTLAEEFLDVYISAER